jgi:Amt family ammonium transporter
VEILLRLPDGLGGVQSAADFLPHAERHNLMPVIDRWVVRKTIALLGQWRREHPRAALPVCSINLSASALVGEDLLAVLEQQLARHDVPADTVCFEIPEAAALANLARTGRFTSAIRAAGCGIGLEDVGSRMASFTYLRALPVDFVKIGAPLVGSVVEDPVYGTIVSAVNQISRSMGIFTVAKQVDSEPVLHRLRALGVGYAQGQALTPPVPLTDLDGSVTLPHLLRTA